MLILEVLLACSEPLYGMGSYHKCVLVVNKQSSLNFLKEYAILKLEYFCFTRKPNVNTFNHII